MKKVSEAKKENYYIKIKKEKLNDYIAEYLSSDFIGKKKLKLKIYSLKKLTANQKDSLWLLIVRSSKI